MDRTRCHHWRPVTIGLDDPRARHFGLDIVTIAAVVGAAAVVAGTAVSVIQSVNQAHQEQTLATDVVAEQKHEEAQAIIESATADETQARRRSEAIISRQRAIAAASGADPASGSPLIQEIDSVQQAELEALQIRRVGQLSANAREYEANIARYRGQSAAGTIPYTIAGGALQAVSGLTSAYGAYSAAGRRSVVSEFSGV